MNKYKKIFKALSLFLWAVKLSWNTSRWLFVFTSVSTFITSSLSGIITTFLAAQTIASVAELASGLVTVSTPIYWAIAFGLFAILIDILRRLTSYFETIVSEQLNIAVTSLYADKVSSFTQEQLDDPTLQTNLSISGRELYVIRNASTTMQDIAASLTAYLLAVIVLWRFAWVISLLLLVLIPIIAVNNYFQIKRRRRSWEESSIHYRISSGLFNYITDPLRLFEIRVMGARDNILKIRKYHLKKELNMILNAERKNAIVALIEDISSPIIELFTRIWAIMLVASGKLAFDQFLFVMGLIQQASSQTFILGYSISRFQETYIAAEALKKIIDTPAAQEGTQQLPEASAGIEIALQGVSLVYASKTKALDAISLEISAGQKVAIVGENGAGKSSLLRLITKQYEPTEGNILLNGVSSTDVKRESLYDQLSVLSQDFYLFDDLTVKENLQVTTDKKINNADLTNALDTVQLSNKISKLPHGLDTRLDKSYNDGSDLSGGQRQRLAIARALLKPYKLLILDEPTSSIDAKAERAIFNAIFERSKNATVLIVSHRFATVRKADYIYVLQEGAISERGTHAELMELNGHYAELYNIQAEDFA